MSHVTVVGAGPAGLVAALEAAEAGHDVVLHEASDRVGGMAGSFEVAGQRVDYGSHRLHPTIDPVLMARVRELLGGDLQTRVRNGRIRLVDRWVGFPLRPGRMVRELPFSFTGRVGADTLRKTLVKPLRRSEPDSFAAAVEQRLGRTVADRFYRPYAHKLYGSPAEDLAVELCDRRVSARSPVAVLRNAVKATKASGRTFYYPRRGYGQISEALADAAVAAGVDLRLDSPVDCIGTRGSLRVGAGGSVHETELVLSTMPLDLLAPALDPAPPAVLTDALATVRIRAMVLVYLVLERPQFTPFDAHYFPDASIRTSRLSESKNYRDGDDPATTTVLCAEVPCWVGDGLWGMPDPDLGALVADELVRSGLPAPAQARVETRRQARVYPTFEQAHAEARAAIDGWQPDDCRLLVFGRQGLAVPDNIHHVMAMGRAAAGVIDGDKIDQARWRCALAEFAANVVQD